MNRSRFLLLAALLALALPACGGDDLVGTYELNLAETKEQIRAGMDEMSDDDPMAKMAKSMLEGMLSNLDEAQARLELKADKTFDFSAKGMGPNQNAEGTYTVEGDKVTLTNPEEEEPFELKVVDGNLHVHQGEGQRKLILVLERKS